MANMNEVLQDLRKEVGVKGSMVVMHDGVVVTSEIGPPLNSDQVAAIASNSIKEINAALGEIGAKAFTKFIFNSTYGKMVFLDAGESYLVVVLDKHLNLDFTMLAIASAGRRIRSIGSI